MSYYDGYSELSFSEKEDYIGSHFGYIYCGANVDRINADASLTESQKDELKQHLRIYGD